MLEELLRALRNWFACGKATGRIRVEGGALVPPDGLSLADGQYLRVQGSVFNDGLHRWPCTGMPDEEFVGTVWALAVPRAVLDLADEIEAWRTEHGDELNGPYQSESFGGYSYTKANSAGDSNAVTGWETAFKQRLNCWRKIKGVRP